jgi:hypothetical protein
LGEDVPIIGVDKTSSKASVVDHSDDVAVAAPFAVDIPSSRYQWPDVSHEVVHGVEQLGKITIAVKVDLEGVHPSASDNDTACVAFDLTR